MDCTQPTVYLHDLMTLSKRITDLFQAEIEELTPEEFAYYLAHGSLEIDAELN